MLMRTKKVLTGTTRVKVARSVVPTASAAGMLGLTLVVAAPACLDRPLATAAPNTTSTLTGRLEQNAVSKIDILLAVDNSASMKDKQEILAAAVPELVERLIQPRCVDFLTGAPTGVSVDAEGLCAEGSKAEFPPIRDINVGVISSSLGDLTTGACASQAHGQDGGRLLHRGIELEETFQAQGFLAWDPDSVRGGDANPEHLTGQLEKMVRGVDQTGCGFEMQLESIVRFLVDPAPYAALERDGEGAKQKLRRVGVDEALLEERKAFLRPDSLVAVVILSDENDCSIDVTSQGYKALPGPFYRATSECAEDANSECCQSCALPIPAGCDAQEACKEEKYTKEQDDPNLKCFKQKERYGIDFLYPVERYVNAFTKARIDPSRSDLAVVDESKAVDNPLFVAEQGAKPRGADLVFVAGIVGVPWQAIARRDQGGQPNLKLGFQNFEELEEKLPALVGDPDRYLEPTDPFMIESTTARSGYSELVDASLPGANPINGGEYTVNPLAPNYLQHTCIFPLAEPVEGGDCENCTDESCDLTLCNGTQQIAAKAYPSLRELSVLSGMQNQGIFASICPAVSSGTDKNAVDYGYNPAVESIIERVKEKLQGECFARQLKVDPKTGNVSCLVLEAMQVEDPAQCCNAPGRAPIPEFVDGEPNPSYQAVRQAKEDRYAIDWNCFCEIVQVDAGEERKACLNELDPDSSNQGDGWCYIDAASPPYVGNAELVKDCPDTEQRLMRFVGDGDPRFGADVFITCAGE